jgi:dipeptidyl-peptidase-4
MHRLRLIAVPVVALVVGLTPLASVAPAAAPPASNRLTLAQYLKPGMPVELVSARSADRIAWIAYEEGKRNVYTAAAPDFKPVRLTAFLKEDGTDMTEIRIADDGSTVAFVRGSAPNRQGWVANPTSDPNGAERAIWAVRVTPVPGTATRLAEGNNPVVSPDGRSVLYVKDGQIYRARVTALATATAIDKGEKPLIDAWGLNSGPRWSPDGTRIAFVSNRTDHSFIGMYDVKARTVNYVAPSTDRDTSPTWSADGKKIAFLRRPGLPFGQQTTPGAGSGLPDTGGGRGGGGGGRAGGGFAPGGAAPAAAPSTPAVAPAPATAPAAAAAQTTPPAASAQTGAAPAGRQGGRGGRGGAGQNAAVTGAPGVSTALMDEPGLFRAAFPGGYSLTLMVADVAGPDMSAAKEVWHPAADDAVFSNINAIEWAGDRVVFSLPPPGGGGRGGGGGGGGGRQAAPPIGSVGPDGRVITDEESPRYYALQLNASATPVYLNTTKGIVEDQTAWTLSPDGKMFYYCTNAVDRDPNDLDRRHIWGVPLSGGTPRMITAGDGIENVPVVLSSNKQIAVLSSDAKRPFSVGIWPSDGSGTAGQAAQKVIYPTLGPDFPMSEEVAPTNVTLKAEDGVEFHSQLFLPKDMKAGEKHPALIFVHGGPARQMLLGWHYLSFYHVFYGVDEWLASKGYVILSVNYRLGVGYGRTFRTPPDGGARGNAEYRDVLAAGKWLAAREDVDPSRVGIWGLSYGGLLTSEALARNSDIFKAGIDLAGVHLEGSSLDPNDVSYEASTISAIDKWKSPVLLIQGDDDRNVNFAQMVGLVDLLRARNVYYELIVYPDDVHETLLHSRWLNSFAHMETFLNKFLPPNAILSK